MTVGVGEVSRIAAPKHVFWLFDEFGPSSKRLRHHPIDTFFGGFVVGHGDSAKA